MALPDSADRAKAIIKAMDSIEADYENLRGILPKSEYQELDNDVLGQLLRTLNPDVLKKVSGDVFGRIYEYFLTQFADQKAHDGGEFFTPVSLVSLIAHVLDPEHGTVLDPACGSGGMFVQSARIVEEHGQRPTERLTFRGLEKNATTIRLAKMNLAVHGLEGDIQKAITYYEDPHELVGKADFVMANPPFNVDEIDADKVKTDPRLPFGLPGVNKKGKVSNGNYVWISYFYSYLNEQGRAGFVMSSQASSAGGGEAKVRRKLVESGDVDVMVAIRSNFFYTRTVPCELWFLNRDKPESHRDKVLMIDARNVYRKVTRKIFDFSPEQQQNLLAIVWLHRGQTDRYLELVSGYCRRTLNEGTGCFNTKDESGKAIRPLPDFAAALKTLTDDIQPFIETLPEDAAQAEVQKELTEALPVFKTDVDGFQKALAEQEGAWKSQKATNGELKKAVDRLAPLAETSRNLVKQSDLLYKLASRLVDAIQQAPSPQPSPSGRGSNHTAFAKNIERPGRGAAGCRRTTQASALFLETGPLAYRTLPRSQTARRGGSGQTGGCERDRGQRLEPDPRPLCGCCPRGRRRKFRLRGDPARDPCGVGRPERRSGNPGGHDKEEFRGVGGMSRQDRQIVQETLAQITVYRNLALMEKCADPEAVPRAVKIRKNFEELGV